MITTIIIFILVLSVLVFVHEFGHFATARKFGVKADEFGLGFPPRAIGVYKDVTGKWRKLVGNRDLETLEGDEVPADTVYSLNWLPIGGFVKIKGENGDQQDEPDSFGSKKIWQRTIILAAGVIMNIILAFVLFSACFMVGAPQSVETGGKIQITEVIKKSPAEKAGILSGDVVIGADNQGFATVPEMQAYIGAKGENEVALKIIRGNENLSINIKPELKDGKGIIGVGLDQLDTVRYSFFRAMWEGLKHTSLLLWMILISFFGLIRDLIFGHGAGDAVGGPIRIAQMTGEVARFGFVNLLNFTALLSLNLAVINILPFPALDGGRIFFLIIEKIKGAPIKRETEAVIHNVGFMFLIALILLVTYKDIARMF
jgi:regulator of sigma E protease